MIDGNFLINARLICDAMDLFGVDLSIIDIINKKVVPKELIYKYAKRKDNIKTLVLGK